MCVVSYSDSESVPVKMALNFFHLIAQGGGRKKDTTASQRGISIILAIIIFGTNMTQTFTGTSVKQEIAEEFIGLPWLLACLKFGSYAGRTGSEAPNTHARLRHSSM